MDNVSQLKKMTEKKIARGGRAKRLGRRGRILRRRLRAFEPRGAPYRAELGLDTRLDQGSTREGQHGQR